MTDLILDFSECPARLNVRNGLLLIDLSSTHGDRDPESDLRSCDAQAQTNPLADIAVLIAAHRQIPFLDARDFLALLKRAECSLPAIKGGCPA